MADDLSDLSGVVFMNSCEAMRCLDLFVIHIPLRNDEAVVSYLADQFKALADFVAKHTGQKVDPLVLRTVVENTNRTRDLMQEKARRSK